ncbi:hypothetical protein GKQ38_03005 [Candidatus Nanohaloarchaea archaeon]|nr:hypothetical protein GKQ38_03005 [Candidatus Nanohaloarchaea archaeon]
MKGQFIAVEAVLSLGIGLMVALGLLTAFTTFQNSIMEDVESSQVDAVQSKVATALLSVGHIENGSATVAVDLPDSIGDSSYQMDLENGKFFVLVGNEEYVTSFENLNSTYRFSGSADGGEVSILKEQNKLILSDR